jgi:hypothetical protein
LYFIFSFHADYTVIKDEKGLYAYADLSSDGRLVASKEKVSKASKQAKTGGGIPKKQKNLRPLPPGNSKNPLTDVVDGAKLKKRGGCVRGGLCSQQQGDGDHTGGDFTTPNAQGLFVEGNDRRNQRRRRTATATVGTLKNLVILLRFRDHRNRAVPTKNEIDILMNSEEAHPIYAPTGSLKMVYWENSYGQLTIESTVADWIQLRRNEAYYANGDSGVGNSRVFHEALREALDTLEARNFDFKAFDQDNDSHIDSITFLTSGYGAEWGGGKRREECLLFD